MKRLLSACICFVLLSCKGQKDISRNSVLADRLVSHYNQKHYDSIFYLFSPEMQAALPLTKTTEFFSQMQDGSGSIIKYDFKEKKESYDRYRAEFARGTYWLSISQNAKDKIDGLYFIDYDGPGEQSSMIRNKTALSLPFSGEWFVFWGGDTKEQNYHVISKAQKNAFDLVITGENGKSFKTDGDTNEDYYAFGQPLIAP